MPFPANAAYRFGIMSKHRNHLDAERSYTTWKEAFVTADSACGFRRVLFDDMRTTTSEGIGYGMLLAVNSMTNRCSMICIGTTRRL